MKKKSNPIALKYSCSKCKKTIEVIHLQIKGNFIIACICGQPLLKVVEEK